MGAPHMHAGRQAAPGVMEEAATPQAGNLVLASVGFTFKKTKTQLRLVDLSQTPSGRFFGKLALARKW